MPKTEAEETCETTITFTFRGPPKKRDYARMLRDAYGIFGDFTAEIGLAAGDGGPQLSLRGLLSKKHDVATGLAHLEAQLHGGTYIVGEEEAADKSASG